MKKTFELLFYCLYRIFRLVKRSGVKDESLTSSFYSILLSTNTLIISFPFKFFISPGSLEKPVLNILFKLIFFGIFICWYLICKFYFLKNGNYVRIINNYEKKYVGRNKQMAIIGIVYSLLTFIGFISIASILSRIKWHL